MALIFAGNSEIAAFVSDDLCSKLLGWCFNYYGDNADGGGKFIPIPSISGGEPFLVADKLPLLVEKCMVPNEITDTTVEARLIYILVGGVSTPLNYPCKLFPVNSAGPVGDGNVIIKFEDSNKTYYAPGFIAQSGVIG